MNSLEAVGTFLTTTKWLNSSSFIIINMEIGEKIPGLAELFLKIVLNGLNISRKQKFCKLGSN